ncbi:MAG: polysaccharide biosynthesis tyrosine autokinase [Leeuwenhoekiella sp.]
MTEKEYFKGKANSADADTFDIKKLFALFFKNWSWFLMAIACSLLLALLYVKYAQPSYLVVSEILIKNDEGKPDFSNTSPFKDLDIFKSVKNIDNEIEVITSQGLMQRTLESLFLTCSFYVDAFPFNREIYGDEVPVVVEVDTLLPSAYKERFELTIIDASTFKISHENITGSKESNTYKFGDLIKSDGATYTVFLKASLLSENTQKRFQVQFNDLEQLAKYYLEKELTVETVSNESSVVRVSLKTNMPERGKRLVNRLIERYKLEDIEDKNEAAASSFDFIDERLRYLTQELNVVEETVADFKSTNQIANVDAASSQYSEQARQYDQKLTNTEIQLDVLSSIQEYLQKNADQVVPSSLGIEDPTLIQIIKKFNDLQTERQRLLQQLPESNVIVRNNGDELTQTRQKLLNTVQSVRNGLNITLRNLRENSQKYSSKVSNVPIIERRLTEISRDQSVKEELYLFLLQRREEAALSLASAVSSSRVIDKAIVDDKPLWPKKKIVFLVALVVGLAIPALIILLSLWLDDRIFEKKEVTQATDVPLLGEVIKGERNKLLVVTGDKRTPQIELFRLLRSNFEFYSQDRENQVILVTSSTAGEGKTFFSVNMGATLALLGKKVVVVSLDLRKKGLLKDLGLQAENGVTDYLISEDMQINDLVQPVPDQDNLYVLASGTVPPNPAELLKSPKLSVMLKDLRSRYDHIILDTSPLGQVADAYALKPLVDTSIFVMRYRYTKKEQLDFLNDIVAKNMLKNPMIVLNFASKSSVKYGYEYIGGKKTGTN